MIALSAPADAQGLSAAAMFGAREDVEDIDLSPDGSTVVFISGGRTTESVVNVAKLGGPLRPITRSSGKPERAYWCNFASNDRLVCRIGGIAETDGLKVGFARLLSIGMDDKQVKELGQRSSFYDTRPRQFDGEILDWLPGDSDAVLMAREYVPEQRSDRLVKRTADGLGVDKIDVKTLKSEVVESVDKVASSFMSDGRGRVRIRQVRVMGGFNKRMTGRTDYYYRRSGSRAWEQLGSYESGMRDGIIPVAIDADLDVAYVLRKSNGRFALYRMKLDGSLASELAYANDKVDVDNVVRVGRGLKVIGATFAEEARQIVYFDEEYKKLAAALSRALPKLPTVRFAGASADGRKLLIFAGSDVDPGRYYVFDRSRSKLDEIILVRPQLEKVALASVKPITYPSSDGVSVPGYLTLPVSKSGRALPTVILPHGGPSARDEWGFDWLAQYLAHQGYAVLQPNYRGSDGFGDAWLQQNGFRSWQTSIGDITAGAKWLVSQGVADPAKLVILGWSYGGYAALQSAVVEPDLYKAVVAIAPVTDLNMIKEEARRFTNSAMVNRFVGDGPHIRQGSPLQNADRITAPVLMFHGDQDINVGVGQARAMDARLQSLGKQSELIVYPGLEHSLVDSTARTQMLERIGAFLATATK